MTRAYLDHNATAPLFPEVVETMAAELARTGNSSSVHAEGRAARAVVEEARENVRALLNAPVNGVVFTGGGTEAIHYALHGAAAAGLIKRVFVSALEHAAVPACAATTGLPVETVPATREGVVDLAWLRQRLSGYDAARDGAFLCCLMVANNETGVIQPVAEAAEIVHEAGGLLFADAAQAAGKVPVNFVMLGADMMAVTGHKFGGPQGVGALVTAPNLALAPVMRGGGHENNRRAGTHNVAGIAGFGNAAALASDVIARRADIASLRDRIEACVLEHGARVWGGESDRLPGTLSCSAPGFSAETQLMSMDLAGIAISSGSACSSGKAKASHVLSAMGAAEEDSKCAIRISLGWSSTAQDVEKFANEWPAAYARVRERAA